MAVGCRWARQVASGERQQLRAVQDNNSTITKTRAAARLQIDTTWPTTWHATWRRHWSCSCFPGNPSMPRYLNVTNRQTDNLDHRWWLRRPSIRVIWPTFHDMSNVKDVTWRRSGWNECRSSVCQRMMTRWRYYAAVLQAALRVTFVSPSVCWCTSVYLSVCPSVPAWKTQHHEAVIQFEDSLVEVLEHKRAVRKGVQPHSNLSIWPCDSCCRLCSSRIGLHAINKLTDDKRSVVLTAQSVTVRLPRTVS